LLSSIRERFPLAELDVLVSDVFSELLEYQGYNVINVDKKGQIRNPAEFAGLIQKLRNRSYDAAIDAAHPHSFSLSGAVATVISGAARRISTDAGDPGRWYTDTVAEPPLDWHESRALHSLGSIWEKWSAWSRPEINVPGSIKRDAAGLHVGASGNKKYPFEFLDKLVDIVSRRVILEIYWGSSEEKKIADRLGDRYPVSVMPRLSVSDLMVRIAGLKFFISPDNGPMHIASALSVPVIALFRIDNQVRFAPLSEGSEILFTGDEMHPENAAMQVLRAARNY